MKRNYIKSDIKKLLIKHGFTEAEVTVDNYDKQLIFKTHGFFINEVVSVGKKYVRINLSGENKHNSNWIVPGGDMYDEVKEILSNNDFKFDSSSNGFYIEIWVEK